MKRLTLGCGVVPAGVYLTTPRGSGEGNSGALTGAIASSSASQILIDEPLAEAPREARVETDTLTSTGEVSRMLGRADVIRFKPALAADLVRWGADADREVPDGEEEHTGHLGGRSTSTTPLFLAVDMGEEVLVRVLVDEAGADVERPGDARGTTPLIRACERGSREIAMALLRRGRADPNKMDREGMLSPLVASSQRGDEEMVNILVFHGANPNLPTRSCGPPLLAALMSGNDWVADYLVVSAGADWNQSFGGALLAGNVSGVDLLVGLADKHRLACGDDLWKSADRFTLTKALWNSCMARKTAVAGVLVRGGCDVNSEMERADTAGTPLFVACKTGQLGLTELLLSAGATADKGGKHGTPLMAACRAGNTDIAELLLAAGADTPFSGPAATAPTLATESQNRRPPSPPPPASAESLALMLWRAACEGNCESVCRCVSSGADVGVSDQLTYFTPLHVVCELGSLECAEVLLCSGSHPDKPAYNNCTPLIISLCNGNRDVAVLVALCGGGQTPVRKSEGTLDCLSSLLWDACCFGDTEMVELLTYAGVQVDRVVGHVLASPLLMANSAGHRNIVESLIVAGADVNKSVGINRDTPLLAACLRGNFSCAELLLCSRARIEQHSADGKTPAFIAALFGHQELCELLELVKVDWTDSSFVFITEAPALKIQAKLQSQQAAASVAPRDTPKQSAPKRRSAATKASGDPSAKPPSKRRKKKPTTAAEDGNCADE